MNKSELANLFIKADESTKDAVWKLLKDPEKYADLCSSIKDGEELKKAILSRAYEFPVDGEKAI